MNNSGWKRHGDGYQINLRIAGKRIRPTLALRQTAANDKHVARLAGDLRIKIASGTFNLATEFPNYKHATVTMSPGAKTFDQAADSYLKLYGSELAYTSRTGYERILNQHWRPAFGERAIDTITDEDVIDVRDKLGVKPKTWNNILIPLRRIFELAETKRWVEGSPLRLIRNRKVQKPLPDPFTVADALVIIDKLRTRFDDASADYFEFAFATGLRTGEQIALEWSQVDMPAAEMKIDRASSWGEDKDTTKTFVERLVTLNPRALAVLTRQRARSGLAGKHVFLNPETGRRYPNDKKVYARWIAVLKLLQVRYRKPYATRASSVSWSLMMGRNPLWVAQQHGHSVATMMTAYAKWVGGDGTAAEAFFNNGALAPTLERKSA